MKDRSRLSRRTESQTKHTILFSIFGIIVILFLLIKFGIPLLANGLLMLSGSGSSKDVADKNKTSDFISPPVLNALPQATNSAKITISGTSVAGETVNLYINALLEETTKAEEDNTFSFEDIELSSGENFIQTKTIIEKTKKESDFSDSYTIIFKKDAPILTVDSPSDNQSFSKDDKFASVRGKTDAGNKVTVNDLWAIVDSAGNFSYNFPLKNGENIIKIKTTDQAGNSTEKEIKVTYSQ